MLLAELPEAAIDVFLEAVADRTATSLMVCELRQLGGALARSAAGGGVVPMLDGAFVAFAGGMAVTPELGMQVVADVRRMTRALATWASGSAYLNFAENAIDPRVAYGQQAWQRLRSVRSAVDPTGVFAANHPIPGLDSEESR